MVEPSRIGGNKHATSNAAIKEKNRITKNLEPMGRAGDTQMLENLEHLEAKVAKLPIPTDYSSPTFLQTITPEIHMQGHKLTTLSGEGDSLYDHFISSIPGVGITD